MNQILKVNKIKSKKKGSIKVTQVNLDWWSVLQSGPREF